MVTDVIETAARRDRHRCIWPNDHRLDGLPEPKNGL
jgi:hypothetical protein